MKIAFAEMEQEGRERLGLFNGHVEVHRAADMRYGEQVFEIVVPLDGMDWEAPNAASHIEMLFHNRHKLLYTYSLPDQDVVVVNARVSVIGQLGAARTQIALATIPPVPPKGRRRIHLGDWTEVPVFDFGRLAPEQPLTGPAIVESETTTVVLGSDDRARFDARGWLDIAITAERGGASSHRPGRISEK